MDKLHDWVFHYNIYRNVWEAAKRDDYNKLFSGDNMESVLRSSSINTLIELITKTDGNSIKLENLIK